jgi:acyl-CoA synthetase (AMP-forming)/AMP-acid ligase II
LESLKFNLECVVGIALEKGIDFIISMIAIWKAGNVYLFLDISALSA